MIDPDTIWPPMLRLLRRVTAAIILVGGWQAIFAPGMPS